MILLRLALVLLLLGLVAPATADERILRFHSDIVIQEDGWIEVTENITVRAEGKQIRRGIFRDLPTEYWDKKGNVHIVSIEPLAVLRNGDREEFHDAKVGQGIRVYFGHENRFLPNGEHTYQFRYRANRMLGFFENHDELYWNVTGFAWAFPIDEASASVAFELDIAASDISYEGYTGPYGSRRQEYTASVSNASVVSFAANDPLSAINGLTIVVGWPKGFVAEPTQMTRVGWFIRDNLSLFIAGGGWVLLLGYYIPVWLRFGKDPEEGPVVTRYEPPHGFSPASLRFIRQMHYDNKVMTAAVVNLAVKGYLRIEKFGHKHSLIRTEPGRDAPPLAPGEEELFDNLFLDDNKIELTDDNHGVLGAAKAKHAASLKADYKNRYFKLNGLLNIPAIAIVIGTLVAAFNIGRGEKLLIIGAIAVLFVTMAGFGVVMKRPTLRGRKVLDQMLGFRDYIEIAEKEELNLRNPPEKTPQLFELYLPYALALDIDQAWAEKFASVLDSARELGGEHWQPGWYSGRWDSSNPLGTVNTVSSGLNSAISSSVSPPSSSSGGGGGGFSGGGGGGGGGGGW